MVHIRIAGRMVVTYGSGIRTCVNYAIRIMNYEL